MSFATMKASHVLLQEAEKAYNAEVAEVFKPGTVAYFEHGGHERRVEVVMTNDFHDIMVESTAGKRYWVDAYRFTAVGEKG